MYSSREICLAEYDLNLYTCVYNYVPKKTQGEDVECCIYTIIVLDQLGAHWTTPATAFPEFYNLQSCLPVLCFYDTSSYFVIIIIQIIFFRAVLRWQENIQLCAEWIWNCFWEWRIYGIHCWNLRTRKFGRYNVRETYSACIGLKSLSF